MDKILHETSEEELEVKETYGVFQHTFQLVCYK